MAAKGLKGTSGIVKKALITASIGSASQINETFSAPKLEDLVLQLANGSFFKLSIYLSYLFY